jgi:hypothetical protein
MKKIIILFMVIAGAFIIPSCSYLDKQPDDQLTMEMIFNDKIRTEDWLAGVYSSIPDTYTGFMRSVGYDVLSDEMTPNSGWKPWDWEIIKLRDGSMNPSYDAVWPANYWVNLPKRIRQGLIFLDEAKALPPSLPASEVNLMKNEVRFLIAYYYWLLLEAYGPVPFTPDSYYTDFSDLEAMMQPQTPFDEIVDWIDKELLEVSKLLPASYTNMDKYGRATSIMCLAVRARVLLFAASDLVNGNPDYAGHLNSEGTPLFSTSKDPKKWEYAAEACKELIEAAHSAGHELYIAKNADGSIDPFMSYQDMMFKRVNEGNREILFPRPHESESIGIADYERDATPHSLGDYGGGLGVTQELVDDFFMEDGLPTGKGYKDGEFSSVSSLYSESGFSNATEIRNNTQWTRIQEEAGGQATGIVTLDKTYNMYTRREPRFYVSVLFCGGWVAIESLGNCRANFLYNTTDQWGNNSANNGTHDSPENGYLIRKKVHPNYSVTSGSQYHNPYRPIILYRLAEAYLAYAEALNESSPGHPDILTYLNKVRERAGIPQYGSGTGAIPVPASQEAMRQAIRRERRLELNNEGLRWTDIRRWKLGEELLNKQFYGMNARGTKYSDDQNDKDAFFKRTSYLDRKFSKKHYWFPVPQTAIYKNPKLVQNPFWD